MIAVSWKYGTDVTGIGAHTIMQKRATILIIAPAGQLRDGLQILLRAIPGVEMPVLAYDCLSQAALEEHACPQFVVVDIAAPQCESLRVVQQIKARCPEVCCIALADSEEECQECSTAGADMVLVKGVLATRLLATIENLVNQSSR
jgi:DNA-binding NarL/FixJ family response regulator